MASRTPHERRKAFQTFGDVSAVILIDMLKDDQGIVDAVLEVDLQFLEQGIQFFLYRVHEMLRSECLVLCLYIRLTMTHERANECA